MFIVLIILLAFSSQTTSSILEKIEHAPGIIFTDLGTTQLYQTTWTLLIHYDLRNYQKEFLLLQNCTKQILQICNKLNETNFFSQTDKDDCYLIYDQLTLQFRDLTTTHDALIPNRQKRSYFDAGGYLLNTLFGTLDERYAKTNDDNLRQLKTKQDIIFDLLKNHTSVLETFSTFVHKTDEEIQTQFSILNKHIAKIDFDRNWSHVQAELHNHLNMISTYAALIFSRFRDTQNHILDSLSSPKVSTLNLLSPEILLQELTRIEQNIPGSLHIPQIANKINTELIFKTSQVESKIVKNRLICIIHIPLVSTTPYQIFRPIPLPMHTQTGYSYIEPRADIIMVTHNRDKITYMTNQEFSSCTQIQSRNYLCKSQNPLYTSKSEYFDCELNLLKHTSTLPPSCKVKPTVPGNYWVQIAPNRFAYALIEPQVIDIICHNNITHFHLSDIGIVNIPEHCHLRNEELLITSETTHSTLVKAEFVPQIDITHLHFNNEFSQEQRFTSPIILRLNNTNQLDDITKSIRNLRRLQAQQPAVRLHFNSNSHYYIPILFSLIILTLLLFVCYKFTPLFHFKSLFKPSNDKPLPTDTQNDREQIQTPEPYPRTLLHYPEMPS